MLAQIQRVSRSTLYLMGLRVTGDFGVSLDGQLTPSAARLPSVPPGIEQPDGP